MNRLIKEVRRGVGQIFLSCAFKFWPKTDYKTMKWFAKQPFE